MNEVLVTVFKLNIYVQIIWLFYYQEQCGQWAHLFQFQRK
jgi:hypothetical protein